MPGKTRKCQYENCPHGKEGILEEMVCIIKNNVKKYWHPDCVELDQQERERKAQDVAEFAVLNRRIMDIHGITTLPSYFCCKLWDVRNGTLRKGGYVAKGNKDGISFDTLSDTYEHCRKSIEWAKKNKNFKKDIQELNYCLSIVLNNVNEVVGKKAREKKQAEVAKAKEANKEFDVALNALQDNKPKVQQKTSTTDISAFLD